MRYLSIWRPTTGEEGGMPDPEHMAAMGALVEEWTAKGALITTEPLTTRDRGARVRFEGGAFTVTDEPQRASGYAMLNAGSREEAIELLKTFMAVAGEGECELRQILEF